MAAARTSREANPGALRLGPHVGGSIPGEQPVPLLPFLRTVEQETRENWGLSLSLPGPATAEPWWDAVSLWPLS